MSTKKILITGIGVDTTEQGIRSLLGQSGPVQQIEIICEGNPEKPVALVEMNIGDGASAYLVSRLTNYWYDGSLVTAHLLIHSTHLEKV